MDKLRQKANLVFAVLLALLGGLVAYQLNQTLPDEYGVIREPELPHYFLAFIGAVIGLVAYGLIMKIEGYRQSWLADDVYKTEYAELHAKFENATRWSEREQYRQRLDSLDAKYQRR